MNLIQLVLARVKSPNDFKKKLILFRNLERLSLIKSKSPFKWWENCRGRMKWHSMKWTLHPKFLIPIIYNRLIIEIYKIKKENMWKILEILKTKENVDTRKEEITIMLIMNLFRITTTNNRLRSPIIRTYTKIHPISISNSSSSSRITWSKMDLLFHFKMDNKIIK